jgi:uncharacterized membrane protein
MSHDHTHDRWPADLDEPAERAPLTSAAVGRLLRIAAGIMAAATAIGLVVLWPRGDALLNTSQLGYADRVDATVVEAELIGCSYDASVRCDVITAEITSGNEQGALVVLEFPLDGSSTAATLRRGDDIVLNDAGPDVPEEVRFTFADFQRRSPLLVLAAVFGIAVVALGRWRGLLALAGLAVSLGVLLAFILPALLRGSSPVAVAVTGASAIAIAVIYLAHGISDRTTVALLGTAASLVLTAVLAGLFAGATELTGLASEESISLLAFAPELDFRGLLLAGIIIGALGVLDDVTVTQVSAVGEIHRHDPTIGARDLYRAGIRVGRDHIASTVNTLILAYAAAALPLLLLFTQSGLGFGRVATSETVAVEIVQALVGSIGLVAAVPITTALAAWVVTRPR